MGDDLALHVVCRLFYSSLVPGVLSPRSKALLDLKRKKRNRVHKTCTRDFSPNQVKMSQFARFNLIGIGLSSEKESERLQPTWPCFLLECRRIRNSPPKLKLLSIVPAS